MLPLENIFCPIIHHIGGYILDWGNYLTRKQASERGRWALALQEKHPSKLLFREDGESGVENALNFKKCCVPGAPRLQIQVLQQEKIYFLVFPEKGTLPFS